MIMKITSSSNSNIKHVKSLHKKKFRDKYGEFILEGTRIVEHALDAGAEFVSVFFSDELHNSIEESGIIERMEDKDIDLYKVDSNLFCEICDTNTPQGILGVVKKRKFNIEEIISKEKYFILVLDRLQDPGNLGTIIRTADAAGVDCIVTNKGCVDTYNDKTIRATMGSIFNIAVVEHEEYSELIDYLNEKNTQIVSTILETNRYHYDVDYGKRIAVIIGNEGNGISDELIEKSNIRVKIPILGDAESLNASIASGIIMYEIVRQRLNSENLKI